MPVGVRLENDFDRLSLADCNQGHRGRVATAAAAASRARSGRVPPGSGVRIGTQTNYVTPMIGSLPVGNTANAKVEVVADTIFDLSIIIGKVFEDEDGDGIQDAGELGVAKAMDRRLTGHAAHTEIGRTTATGSELTLALRPDNHGVLLRRNGIAIFLSLEIMLNSANLAFVAFAMKFAASADTMAAALSGQVFVFFVIGVAAAEAAVGLALFIALHRLKESIDVDRVNILRW